MDKHRVVMVAVGFAILAALALGYLFGIQPQLSAVGDANAQTASIDQSNQASQLQLAKLQKDYARLGDFKSQLATVQTSIPSTPSLDALLADIRSLAASTGTTLTAFTPAQPVAYTPPIAPVTAAPAKPTASGGSTPTPAPTAAAAPTAPVAPRPATNPLITAQNFVAIPISLSITGSTDAALTFVDGLQHGHRMFLVTGFSGTSQAAGTTSGGATAGAAKSTSSATGTVYSVNGFVYVLRPAKQGVVATSK
jgi:hypothetical protein